MKATSKSINLIRSLGLKGKRLCLDFLGGLGTSKGNSMPHSISEKVRVNLLMVTVISIIATKKTEYSQALRKIRKMRK